MAPLLCTTTNLKERKTGNLGPM